MKTSGSLPDGLTVDSTGLISGTPTAPGSASFTVTVTDSATPSPDVATESITITVDPAQAISISTSLRGTYAGEYYDGELEASGGTAPYTWSITTGSLPPGLALDASTGEVTGYTTEGGIYDFNVGVRDSSDPPATGSISASIDVQPPTPLEVTSTSLVDAVAGTYYGSQLSSSGGYGYSGDDTWSVTSGKLPPGIELNSDGYLEGNPMGSGTYAFTVAVTDGASPDPDVATTNLVLVVDAPQPLTVNPTSLPAGTVDTYYDEDLDASGGIEPYTWALVGGALPPGLTMDEDGELYGTPSASGSFSFSVTLTDSTVPTPDESTVPFTLVIEAVQPLVITTPSLPDWVPGTYYNQQLASSGGTGDDTWSITSGALPEGVSLYDDGYLYGEPQASGSFTFTVEVTDDASPTPDVATQTYTVDFPQPSAITITTTSLDGITLGEYNDEYLDATGGDGNYTWSVSSGALPDGVTLDSYGDLYGEPTDSGTYTFTVEVTDDETPTPDVATETYTVDLPPPLPITITSPNTINLTLGEYKDEYLDATGGDGNYTWSVSSGALPDGVTLDSYGDLYGTPTTAGTTTVTLTVTDDVTPTPDTASTSFTIAVPTAAELAVTSAPPSGLSLGSYFQEALTSTGGYGSDTWSLSSGTLPEGLNLDSDGYLYGSPSEYGTFTFTLLVTDSNAPTPDVATQLETVTVPPPRPIEVTAPTLPTVEAGQNLGIDLQASGGYGGLSWSVSSGTLPDGVTLDSDGYLYGSPLQAGSFSFTVEVTDDANPIPDVETEVLTLSVTAPPPLTVSFSTLDTAVVGQYYEDTFEATGGIGSDTWTWASGSLPGGLMLQSDGEIFGYPTVPGTFEFTAEVTDEGSPIPGETSVDATLVVVPGSQLTVVTTHLPSATEGSYYDGRVTAFGGEGDYTWLVASGTLPAGLTLESNGSLYGTPTSPGTVNFTVQVTDQATPLPDVASQQFTMTVAPPPPLTVETTGLESGVQGQEYSQYLDAQGGLGSLSWSLVSGSLPSGLTLSSSGELSGIPQSAGTFNFTVQVEDSTSPIPEVATASLSLALAPAGPVTPEVSSIGSGTEGQLYDAYLYATGGIDPLTWSIASGQLPAGVTLSSDGELSGYPTQSGTFSFVAAVTDSAQPAPDVVDVPLTFVLAPAGPLTVALGSLSATQGSPYIEDLYATGGFGPYAWSLDSGSLPPGLTLDSGGYIEGTPTTAGTFRSTVEVTGADGNGVLVGLTFTVTPDEALSLASVTLPSATEGVDYCAYVGEDSSGGVWPYTWSVYGSLPPGLTLNAEGELCGEPTSSGAFTFTVIETDSALPTPASAAAAADIVVQPANTLTGATDGVPPGTQGEFYDGYLQADGGVGPYTWSVASGVLPPGLTLDSSGEISGYPSESGSFAFTAEVTDSGTPVPSSVSVPVDLDIAPGAPLEISAAALPGGTDDEYYDSGLEATGGIGPYTWSLESGSLPSGVSLDQYGSVYGTPTTSGVFSFTVEVTDAAAPTPDVATLAETLDIGPPAALQFSYTELPEGTQGQFYSGYIAAEGGTGPFEWSVSAGSLPNGLALSSDGSAYADVIGTPTSSGSSTVTIEVSDSTSPIPQSVSQQVTLEFSPAGPLAVDGEPLGSCTVGQLCSDPLSAEGGIGPYTWALASGSLPAGLELDASGNLTGTPLEAGTFSFTAQATDSATPNPASAKGAFTIVVAPAAPLSVTAPTLPAATQGQWYYDSEAFPVSGGISPYTLSVVSGALPAGLEMDAYGDLYGEPSAAGTFAFVVGATDSADPIPDVATVAVTLVVTPAPSLAISTTSLSSGNLGEKYDAEFEASGGVPPYTWSVVSGAIPNGLTFESSGELQGVPTQEGSFTFGIGLSDSATPASSVSETFTVVIGPSLPLAITTSDASPGIEGSTYETTLDATGGTAPYTWSLTSGSLPEGVGVDSYGDLFGTPETSGTFTFTVTATDAASPIPDAASGQVTLVIAPPPSLVIATTGLPAAIQGQEYEDEIEATGGIGPFTWSISSGTLPAGMQLDSDGTLGGYPATPGTFDVTLEVTDGNLPTPDVASESVQLDVESGSSLSVSSLPLGEATEGQYFDDDGFYATGGDGPYTWSVASGELPPGIVVDSTGDLVGEPLQSGVFSFELEVTDSGSPTPSTSEVPGVLVVEPAAPLSIQGADLSATQGQYSYEEFQADGGAGTYTWSVQAGVVPPGLTLDPEGYLTGVPLTAGTYQFSVEVTDSAVPSPDEASGVVTVMVGPAPTLEVVTPVLLPATEGAEYGDFLSASGGVGSDTWSVTSGTLPTGLSLDGSGYLSGSHSCRGLTRSWSTPPIRHRRVRTSHKRRLPSQLHQQHHSQRTSLHLRQQSKDSRSWGI